MLFNINSRAVSNVIGEVNVIGELNVIGKLNIIGESKRSRLNLTNILQMSEILLTEVIAGIIDHKSGNFIIM